MLAKCFSFQTSALDNPAQKSHLKKFSESELMILWKRFEKNIYICREEANDLAQVFNVKPDKIFRWFKHQRSAGGLQAMARAVEGMCILTIFKLECLL